MTINELKEKVSNWSRIELVANKPTQLFKKGWIKCYDLNDDDFDVFDSFELLAFTSNYKLRATLCVPGIATVAGSNKKAKELLVKCVNEDLKEGFTFKE